MLVLACDGPAIRIRPVPRDGERPCDLAPGARLIRLRRGCALLARGRVSINGLPALPLTVLHDRDEIRVASQIFYFTTDGIPAAAVLRSATALRCARCLGGLADGERAISCPRCRAHHHAGCWADRSGCQKCQHPPDRLAWIPEPVW